VRKAPVTLQAAKTASISNSFLSQGILTMTTIENMTDGIATISASTAGAKKKKTLSPERAAAIRQLKKLSNLDFVSFFAESDSYQEVADLVNEELGLTAAYGANVRWVAQRAKRLRKAGVTNLPKFKVERQGQVLDIAALTARVEAALRMKAEAEAEVADNDPEEEEDDIHQTEE
jgi:hypothetical protein